MNHTDDEGYMQRAIVLASEAQAERGDAPIGCVIVLNGKVAGECASLCHRPGEDVPATEQGNI